MPHLNIPRLKGSIDFFEFYYFINLEELIFSTEYFEKHQSLSTPVPVALNGFLETVFQRDPFFKLVGGIKHAIIKDNISSLPPFVVQRTDAVSNFLEI